MDKVKICEDYWKNPKPVNVAPDTSPDKFGKPSGSIRAVITHTPEGGGVDARDLRVTVTKDDSAGLDGHRLTEPTEEINEGASISRNITADRATGDWHYCDRKYEQRSEDCYGESYIVEVHASKLG